VPDVERRLATLSPDKRALFEKLAAESAGAENVFPLSVFQPGMWFVEQLRPNNPAYLLPGAVHIRGELHTEVLVDAMNEIVRRHEALRTTFELRDGRPMQIVHAWVPVDLPEVDLREAGLTEAGLQDRIVAEALGKPMNHQSEPLMRMALLHTGTDEHVLVLTLHHLVSDRWSVGILLSELSALYDAFDRGHQSPLVEPAIQYGDFSTWQQQELIKNRWAPDLEYWRQHLAGAPAALELPTDRPRPAVQGFNGDIVRFDLPESLMGDLGALAHRRGATTYMALLAAFTVLLHRYSNQDDVVVGVPAAARGRAEIESLIGYFVNTLPIRTDLSGNLPFAQILDQVRTASLEAYAHQDVPFDVVVADLNTARDLSRPPVFQVSFSYGREPAPDFALGATELTRLPVRTQGARFDLELQAFDRDGGVDGWFEYDRDLFDEPTIARMARHFRHVIEQVVADPDQRVDELELLDDTERQRILVGLNDTGRHWPDQSGWIHQCFEDRVRELPCAPALRFEGSSLSYQELNRRANQLAHRLIRLGAGRDVLVGVAMERSPELVVSLLAVLKAGAAYVPLDPDYPRARLELMIAEAQVPVLLTQRRLLEKLPPVDAEIICVDELCVKELCVDEHCMDVLGMDGLAANGFGEGELQTGLCHEPGGNPEVAVDGEDLAYVIYTSGSTGVPKGVMNVHAAIRNRLLWMQDTFPLDAADRVLQKTPFSFDVSVWEFFWPLMAGATLVVARPGGHKDSAYLARTIRGEAVTTMHFVPSMLQVFLAEPVEDCTSLRRVICSGEALPRDLQDRFLARSGAELHNLYGPTEAAIDVTHWACRRDDDQRPVPIGMPIANTQIYVLDRFLQPVPVGVSGELHIGGRNLARGYVHRPELTAEKFIKSPFDPGRGARLYKTGDLARFRDDGAVEFLGRLDHQVKLRGFRIELGEIEAVLADHEQVREAVVVAREHRPGDLRLIAYLTLNGTLNGTAEPGTTGSRTTAPDTSELTSHLRMRLPEYMVPACFEVLDEFPLTSSGKVDRQALPVPASVRPDLGARFVAPRDDLENTLAGLWCTVLGTGRVGMHDNFFDLGGHSLLMAELRALLAAETGHEVSMVDLFQHPTVASLAEHLSRAADAPGASQHDARERAESRQRSIARRQHMSHRRTRLQKR
jgi:amino acid adenylation domain-containing protein